MTFEIEWHTDGYHAVTPDGIDAGPFPSHDKALAYAERREEHYDDLHRRAQHAE